MANKAKSNKSQTRAKKPFDKYQYYLDSVQAPDSDVEFIRDTYKEIKGIFPEKFREDFCGTFALACEWVKLNQNNVAYGIDIDPEPISYGKKHHFTKLEDSQKKRLHILQENVLSKKVPSVDVIGAFNFSYFCFKERTMMKSYFQNCYKTLNSNGVFIVDLFGGPLCQKTIEEKINHGSYTYFWDQKNFDPVDNSAHFEIHFQRKGEKKRQGVFKYDWRMWTIPEIREIMEEVGFKKTHVYWEGDDNKGGGNGIYTRVDKGEECEAWVAYVVGEK